MAHKSLVHSLTYQCFSLKKPLREVSDFQIDGRTCHHEEVSDIIYGTTYGGMSHLSFVNDDGGVAPFHISLDMLRIYVTKG